jgi:hypothetical protein
LFEWLPGVLISLYDVIVRNFRQTPTLKLSFKGGTAKYEHTIKKPISLKEFTQWQSKNKQRSIDNFSDFERCNRKRLSVPVKLEYRKTSHKTAKNIVITLRISVDPKMFDVSENSTSQSTLKCVTRPYIKASKFKDHIQIILEPKILAGTDFMSDEVQPLRPFYLYYKGCTDYENPETITIRYEICAEDFKPGKGDLKLHVIKDNDHTLRQDEG